MDGFSVKSYDPGSDRLPGIRSRIIDAAVAHLRPKFRFADQLG